MGNILSTFLHSSWFRRSIPLSHEILCAYNQQFLLCNKMELNICKVIALIVLPIVSFFCAFLPLKIRKVSKFFRSKNERKDSILTVIQCFGGGILLGTVLIILLPEIREGLSSFNDASIPLAELLLSAGFFIIYLIEELLQFAKPDYCKHLSHFQVFSEDQDENENIDKLPNPVRTSTPEPNNTEGVDTVDQTIQNNSNSRFNEISLDAITSSPEDLNQSGADNSFTSFNPKYAGSLNTSTQSMFPNYRPNVEASKVQRSTLKHSFQLPKINLKSPPKDKPDTSEKAGGPVFSISRQELIATILLCCHSLVEGLSVGLAMTTNNVWQLFAVILVHQIITSLSLGIAMSMGKSSLASIMLFTISSCVGVAIGIGISSIQSSLEIYIVTGVTSGAIFYIVILEVIHQEKSRQNVSGLLQFGSILFGFIVTVLIKILSTPPPEQDATDETVVTELPPPIIGG